MNILNKKNFNPKNLINIIFCLYPITFAMGNTAININTLTIILVAFIFFRKDLLEDFYELDKLVIFFFIYVLLVGLINIIDLNFYSEINIVHFENSKLYIFFKSLFYLRYCLLFFIISYLIKKNIIKFNNFFLISTIMCLFLSFDLLIQLIFNKDIFGIVPTNSRKLSGFFGTELIAGGYIQKFYFFLIFFFIIFYNHNKKYLFFTFALCFVFFAAIISGNRMPLILILFGFFLLFIFFSKIRKYLIILSLSLSLIFGLSFFLNSQIKINYTNFYNQVYKIIKVPFSKEINRSDLPDYFDEFESFYDTWQLNKYFGGGVKSFRIYCPYRKNISIGERPTCNTHPHNYYLEILTETGIFGLIIVLLIIYNRLKKSLNFYLSKIISEEKNIILPFLILFILEIFPLKNTGSFFSTFNATYIFILLGCLEGLSRINQSQLKTK